MKIYISGSITKDPDYIAKFERAEKSIKNMHHENDEIVNPVRTKPLFRVKYWLFYMIPDLVLLIQCKKVIFLPCWYESWGAKIEMFLAKILKKQIAFITFGPDYTFITYLYSLKSF